MAREDSYTITMYILAGLLIVGLICNWLVSPVHERHYLPEKESENETVMPDAISALLPKERAAGVVMNEWRGHSVAIALAWDTLTTVKKAAVLFN